VYYGSKDRRVFLCCGAGRIGEDGSIFYESPQCTCRSAARGQPAGAQGRGAWSCRTRVRTTRSAERARREPGAAGEHAPSCSASACGAFASSRSRVRAVRSYSGVRSTGGSILDGGPWLRRGTAANAGIPSARSREDIGPTHRGRQRLRAVEHGKSRRCRDGVRRDVAGVATAVEVGFVARHSRDARAPNGLNHH